MTRPLRILVVLILLFFSLSTTQTADSVKSDDLISTDTGVITDPPVTTYSMAEQTAEFNSPPPTMHIIVEENGLQWQEPNFENKNLPLILEEQHSMIHENIHKADEMGKELDKIIQILEQNKSLKQSK